MKMVGDDTHVQAADGTLYQKIEGFFEVAEQHVEEFLKAGLRKIEDIMGVGYAVDSAPAMPEVPPEAVAVEGHPPEVTVSPSETPAPAEPAV